MPKANQSHNHSGTTQLENARVKYQVAIDKNISESEILWSRYNAMLLFNSILIVAIGFIYNREVELVEELEKILTLSLPIFGLALCYFWLQMTLRGFQWIDYWIIAARKIEKAYLKDECNDRNPVLEGNEYKNRVIGWPKTQPASYLLIIMIAILYFIFFISTITTNQF